MSCSSCWHTATMGWVRMAAAEVRVCFWVSHSPSWPKQLVLSTKFAIKLFLCNVLLIPAPWATSQWSPYFSTTAEHPHILLFSAVGRGCNGIPLTIRCERVSVRYCCVTNYLKIYQLNTTENVSPYTSNGHESRSSPGWFGIRVTHEAAGPVVIESWRIDFPIICLAIGRRPQFLPRCGLNTVAPCRVCLSPRTEATVFYNLRSEVAFPHFCYILLATETSPGTLGGGCSTKDGNTRKLHQGAPLPQGSKRDWGHLL